MVNLIVDISRYVMILLIAVYTWLNFRYFSFHEEGKQKRICGHQNRCMFLIHLLAYNVLWLKTEDARLIVFYGIQVVFFLCYIYAYRLFYHNISRLLANNMCMLLSIGFIILSRLSFERALRQFVVAAVAAVITWIIPYIMNRVRWLSEIPWVYGFLGLVLLGIVLAKGIKSYGAHLSVGIGGLTFQPSEFVKISFVFFAAAMLYHSARFRIVLLTTLAAGSHVLILVLSRDLGSALIFFAVYVLMVFAATGKPGYLLGGAGAGAVSSVLAYRLFEHVRTRVLAWKNPWADIDNKGYQIAQSLFAIGTGGWFGMGLCQGMPGKIPVVQNDFVFSAISEEFGGIFALCVLFICFGCFLQFMMIAGRLQSCFYKLIAFGLGMVYIIQVFLNVAGVTKFIPSTGVTLPLMSYGGSSVFSTFILFGVMQGLYLLKGNEQEEEQDEKS